MAMKKGGLGKGLDALFVENSAEESGKIVSLRIADIVPNRAQPRKQFDEAALAELTESIAQHGVLQPLLVRPMPDGSYQLVAGERRWRASRQAGLTEVPVVIREMTDREAAELALIENLQREDLNPMEEARGYRTLMETYGLTQEETAKAVNKSRPAVANALRLLNLPDAVAEQLTEGKLSAGHARAVLSFPTEAEQLAAAEAIVAKGLSVRDAEKMAKAANNDRKKGEPSSQTLFSRDSLYDEVALSLTEHLGRRVKVVSARKGGVLQIEFYDNDDLKSLANKFN
jgi:ParB family chromosome partitioning protein